MGRVKAVSGIHYMSVNTSELKTITNGTIQYQVDSKTKRRKFYLLLPKKHTFIQLIIIQINTLS